ncbi:hypothetical protein QJS10_CPA05g02015 [Acorus calamus]|uniref:CRAL-TRIO domain-containing protein n=1 Tax=Acorus calamus TaxID=4465 RepID=A0AAV9EVC9_ACOCL|nr:hypothetical protein QJS10_CPA05g02015 [Acorus calamus]
MGIGSQDAMEQLMDLADQVDEPLKNTFQNMHQGYPNETLLRFLKAREWNVPKAHKMKPIVPTDLYRSVRDSQLIGLSGYTREGLPVIAIGVGLSTFDKASVNYYVQSHIQINEYRDRVILPAATKQYGQYIGTCVKILDMTGLRLSALSQIKALVPAQVRPVSHVRVNIVRPEAQQARQLDRPCWLMLLTIISTVDDLNYPEKTDTYYIVNVPYVFSACWKVVKPLLQERTRRKVQVLQGCGRDELLKIMDYASLPHFCRREGSGSSRHSTDENGSDNCFSLDHTFHQRLYSYIKQQSLSVRPVAPIKQGSFHVEVPEPDPEDSNIGLTIESEFQKFSKRNGLTNSLSGLNINVD